MNDELTQEEQEEIQSWKDMVMSDIKITCPELLTEFNRLKGEREKTGEHGFSYHMRTLQMDMIYGPEWKWRVEEYNLPQFNQTQIKKIDKITNMFFKQLEMGIRRNEFDRENWIKKLIADLEKAAINTKGSVMSILNATIIRIHPKTHVFDMLTRHSRYIHPTNNFYALENESENEDCMPDELKYY